MDDCRYNQKRHRSLVKIVESWKENIPDDPFKLASDIEQQCELVEWFPPKPGMSLKTWQECVDKLSRNLEKSIKSLEELPKRDRVFLHEDFYLCVKENPRIKESLATQLLYGFDGVEIDDVLVELLKTLSNAAKSHAEVWAPLPYERPRYEIEMIRGAASVCQKHGVVVGASSGGHFLAIVETILPEAKDPRDLIRQALRLGKYAKKI